MNKNTAKIIIASGILVFTLGASFNIAIANNPLLGLLLGIGWSLLVSLAWGRIIFPEEKIFWKIFFGALATICLIIIFGSAFYYLRSLNITAIIGVIAAISLSTIIVLFFTKNNNQLKLPDIKIKIDFKTAILALGFIFFEAVCFYILIKSATGDAIRSPWWSVPGEFFIFYFLATVCLAVVAAYGRHSYLTIFATSIHFFLSTSVALFVYKLGYGFDPFIHRATEQVIANFGSITPKPFYYVGQYALVVIASKIFFLPVDAIDKLLVPLLFSILLPPTIYHSFKNSIGYNFSIGLLPLVILAFPFADFIVTTPQALANIFILIAIFLSLPLFFKSDKKYLTIFSFLLAATLVIHPLAGIPLLIFSALIFQAVFLKSNDNKYYYLKKIVSLEIFVISSVSLPLIFIFNSQLQSNLPLYLTFESLFNIEKIGQAFNFLAPYLKNNFNLVFDIGYWYGFNVYLIIIGTAIAGVIASWRKKTFKFLKIYLTGALIIFINYLIIRLTINFPSIIDYERINYAKRILDISVYFLLPIFIYAWFLIFSKSRTTSALLRLMPIVILAISVTASLYISYPRSDDYNLDRGYNITQTDINAVRLINDQAQGDYIVLANQMTSVAAIREFGFKKYYQDKTNPAKLYFYYPIPTGDPLYQFYLDMVYKKPTKKIAGEAAGLAGVPTVYLILNKYWWKFDQLAEEAKQEADEWQSIDQGQAYIFTYLIKPENAGAEKKN